MGLIKHVPCWSNVDGLDFLSVNPTRDEVSHYRVKLDVDSDESIVKLNTVKDFGNITCLDYSKTDDKMVAVGEKSGILRLFSISETDDEYNGFDLRVRAKQQRTINSLSVNTNGLIAMGLERNKHDASLQVWDVNYQSTESNMITPSFSYCVNESIVSLKFVDDTSILASSTKLLKEIDLRVPNPVYQHPTRISYDIKINPFNPWQFSTYADDGTLAFWDRRKLASISDDPEYLEAQPLLKFEKLVGHGAASRKYMNSCFRWSPLRNGEFSTLHSGASIKRWRLATVPDLQSGNELNDSLFVSTVTDIKTTYDRVVTFDYIPTENGKTSLLCMRQSGTIYRMNVEHGFSKSKINNYNSIMSISDDNSNANELRITGEDEISIFDNLDTGLLNLSFEDLDTGDDLDLSDTEDRNSVNSLENDGGHTSDSEEVNEYFIDAEKLLQNDISFIMRKRASLGYGLDPMKTVEMIDKSRLFNNNIYIRNTWRWMAIAKASIDDGTMVSGDLDLGYEGILGIWNGLEGLSNQNRYRSGGMLTEKQLNKELDKIIKMRSKSKNKIGNVSSLSSSLNSKKSIQRKLCMIISGWDLSPADYEEKYKALVDLNHYEKAAAWAVFFGDVQRAISILGSANKERLRLIAAAIAGYQAYSEKPGDNAWRQQCRKMAAELDDPYLRVIFSFVADNDWWDILYESAISLRERLGVALRFLNDTDLTRFLERTATTVIENGELEGLILTGITPSGIDLLQSYVGKTSDVQTAALISVFGSPRYFKDQRVDEWVETYRYMLNSWEFFTMRGKFDVLKMKLSRTSDGRISSQVKPRQMYLQCSKCKKNINKPSESSSSTNMARHISQNVNGAKKFGLNNTNNETPQQKHSCPHCGTSYPRCAICLLPLGTSNLPIVINGTTNSCEVNIDQNSKINDLTERKRLRMNEWFSFCLKCNHGMHAGHAEEWFERHFICPVPGCSCLCHQ
ncbi:SEH-associated protein 4 [Kluyveromyces marxianus]